MNNLKECFKTCTLYYFDDIIKIKDFDFDVLLHGKSCKNISVYNISYKTLIGTKSLRIQLDKEDGFIRVYDGGKYLVSFGTEKYHAIYNRIRYLLSQKTRITYVFFRSYPRIKVTLFDSLSLEKTLTLHNVIILIKSVFIKNQDHYYYFIFLEKCLYQLAEK